MENGRKEYTFFWLIENYSFCWHGNGEELISPPFSAEGLEGTAWNLGLYPRGIEDEDKGYVSLFLNRSATDDGPESYSITYELAVPTADGSLLRSVSYENAFGKGRGRGSGVFLKMDEIFLRRKADYLPQDILTVCCKIWKGEGNVVRNIGQSSARTRIKVEKISFLHEVERFSTLQPNVKQTIQVPSNSREQSCISSSLYLTEGLCCEKKIMIEIVPYDTKQFLRKCKLSLLHVSGNELGCGEADIRYYTEGKGIRITPLSLTREEILKRKSEYLPDDKLSLLCECAFSSGLEFQAIEETVHKMPLPAVKQKRYRVPRKNIFKDSETMSTYPSALEDIKALYINKFLTDVQLKTKTKSFPAHKNVLCARSSVFKRMMTSDMKEKNSDCIEVDDLDDDVLQQMLLFLYSDIIENLQWEMATQLYYAADKYEVVKLKAVCSSFLLENLSPTNAGQLLLLADTHSDGDLKKSVEDFILENEKGVFGSKEWDRLLETNSQLAGKTMQLKYKRRDEDY